MLRREEGACLHHCISINLAFCLSISQLMLAEPVAADETPLDQFIADLADKQTIRHYDLVSKQSAIHSMYVDECMHRLGFEDQASVDLLSWNQALYGEFAYCQDHHIPGIDPPCPAEDVVERSINASCWQRSHQLVDWSHDILRDARQLLESPQNTYTQNTFSVQNQELTIIESEWAACMSSEGFNYPTRFSLYESLGRIEESISAAAVNSKESEQASATEQAIGTDQAIAMKSAERCFDVTGYYAKQKEVNERYATQSAAANTEALSVLLERYERAEQLANESMQQYCELMPNRIRAAYKQGGYSTKPACD